MRTNPTPTLVAAILVLLVCTTVAHAFLLTPLQRTDGTIRVSHRTVTIFKSVAARSRLGTLEIANPAAQIRVTGPVEPDGLPPATFTAGWHPAAVDADRLWTVAADTSGITFDHVWARPTAGAGTTGAAYFTVTNNGAADELVGASTPIATAGVHETTDDNGVMKMRPVAAIALAPGKPVTLKPGGYHVMLTKLKNPLKIGDSFPLTLSFAHAQPVTVTVKVETAGGAGMDHGAMPGMH